MSYHNRLPTFKKEHIQMAQKYQLYGDPFSYYSAKALAYLKFKNIPFEMILPTPDVYRDVIVPRTGVQYIPVLISPDDIAVQDTTEIIDFLEERHPKPSIYPLNPRQKLTSLLFELYADEWLLIPAMHYRWTYNEDFAFAEFGRFAAPDAPEETRRKIGAKASARFRGAMPALGITARTAPAIEAWYEELLSQLNNHFSTHDFLLGTRPCIGDFALFGPLYAHLYRDPWSGAMMDRTAPHVARWVQRMDNPEGGEGAFLENDAVPETLFPILTRLFSEHFPVLADTAAQVEAWLETHEGEEISRAIGAHNFTLAHGSETITEKRLVFPYAQWMLQRALDCYGAFTPAQKTSVDGLLDAVGGGQAMQTAINRRVARVDNKLVPAG